MSRVPVRWALVRASGRTNTESPALGQSMYVDREIKAGVNPIDISLFTVDAIPENTSCLFPSPAPRAAFQPNLGLDSHSQGPLPAPTKHTILCIGTQDRAPRALQTQPAFPAKGLNEGAPPFSAAVLRNPPLQAKEFLTWWLGAPPLPPQPSRPEAQPQATLNGGGRTSRKLDRATRDRKPRSVD